jgi:hypothetical protein
VIFGGFDALGLPMNDTWEWDGASWTQRASASPPPPRFGHAMTFDRPRGRTLLFGGFAGGSIGWLADTWTWDGNAWTQLAPPVQPAASGSHAVAYDAARARVVLHGGTNRSGNHGWTWEWDGSTWASVTPPTPQGRHAHALAPDGAQGLVLFGGQGGSSGANPPSGDTWRYHAQGWSQLFPANAPTPRHSHAVAWDSVRGRQVLFGGSDGASSLADTWEWDGNDWLARSPATSPPARHGHVMAYDERRGRVVLFGGYASTTLGDHWEWDGTNWTQRTGIALPPARSFAAMCRDSRRDRLVLNGGSANFIISDRQDTWEFDGSTWTMAMPQVAPAARHNHSLAFDEVHGVSVLFGGQTITTTFPPQFRTFGDTFEWDGSSWVPRAAGTPVARSAHAAAFDPTRGVIGLFGGTAGGIDVDDSWQWSSPNPPSFAPFGVGCAGAAGVPFLTSSPSRWPLAGGTFSFDVVRARPNAPVALYLGLSRTSLGAIPLPLDLAFLGMPGCTLYQSADLLFGMVANGQGVATWSVPIPSDPFLLGFRFHHQAYFVDTSANALGVVISNAAEARVGS